MKHIARLGAAATALALLPLVAVPAATAAPVPARVAAGASAGDVGGYPPKVVRSLRSTVVAKPGQNVVFRLPSNETTGYRYTVKVVSNTAGARVSTPAYVPPANPIPGRGGTTVVRVWAGHSGELVLRFRYAQPFGDGGSDRTVTTVTILWSAD